MSSLRVDRPDVAILVRSDHATKPGGDTIQFQHYKTQVEKSGLKVGLYTFRDIGGSGARLFHLTNVDRPFELLAAYKSLDGRPLLLMPVHHERAQSTSLNRSKRGAQGALERTLDYYTLERLKHLVRTPLDVRTIACRAPHGVRTVLARADRILLAAPRERKAIERDFGVRLRDDRVFFLPNGLPAVRAQEFILERSQRPIDVLVVGRIEPRKNQLNILRGLAHTDLHVTIAGAATRPNRKYFEAVLGEIRRNPRFTYLGALDHTAILDLYLKTKTYVSLSYFEVLSLADMEAARSGCSMVVSANGYTSDYLRGAIVMNPEAWRDLPDAIARAASCTPQLSEGYPTWEMVGQSLCSLYSELLDS